MRKHSLTQRTNDPEALAINRLTNDLIRMTETGRLLRKVLTERFGGDITAFNRWLRGNVDISPSSAKRYIALAEHGEPFIDMGYHRLMDVYERLGIADKPEEVEAPEFPSYSYCSMRSEHVVPSYPVEKKNQSAQPIAVDAYRNRSPAHRTQKASKERGHSDL